MAPIRLLLDTDIGTDADDAVALALLLASPEVELRAVTTVSGDIALRGQIARKLLTLGGRPAVPVAAGIREPILRRRSFLWLGHEGRGIVDPAEAPGLAAEHGVDLFIDTVLRERPQVVAIGPLSNLAVAIMKDARVIEAIPHLTVMGGALHPDDPEGPSAELDYNFCSDAEAAQVVLDAGIPTTVVPIDVTLRVYLTPRELARLRAVPSPLLQTLCDAIEIWWPIHRTLFAGTRQYDAEVVCFLHDPLALATVFAPQFVRLERRRLRPQIVDGAFRLLPDPTAPELTVAVGVDAAGFVEFVVDRLRSHTPA